MIATELRSVNNDLRAQRLQLENMKMSGATTSETEALERAILGNETKKAGLKSKAAESTANINTPLPSPDFPTKNKALEWWNSLTTVEKVAYPTGALITIGGIAYVVTPSGKVKERK